MADEARRLSDALAATQMALAREQQLSALGGLAAAAARSGQPARDHLGDRARAGERGARGQPAAEDVAELVSQSQRCREILKTLGQRAEREALRPFTSVPLSAC